MQVTAGSRESFRCFNPTACSSADVYVGEIRGSENRVPLQGSIGVLDGFREKGSIRTTIRNIMRDSI